MSLTKRRRETSFRDLSRAKHTVETVAQKVCKGKDNRKKKTSRTASSFFFIFCCQKFEKKIAFFLLLFILLNRIKSHVKGEDFSLNMREREMFFFMFPFPDDATDYYCSP